VDKPRRRVNGFAVFASGRLQTDSIRRSKIACILDFKHRYHALVPEWDELAERHDLIIRRVQIVILDEVRARHGSTGRKRVVTPGGKVTWTRNVGPR
jgi:hypothetical protein